MVLEEKMKITQINWSPLWPSPSLDATQCRHHDWRKRRRSKKLSTAHPVRSSSSPLRSKNVLLVNLVILLTMIITLAEGLILEPSIQTVGVGGAASAPVSVSDDGLNFNMENKIAAIFSRVSYGSTTTKRSISDSVVQSSLTTIPTPFLTTYRYREKEKEPTNNKNHELQKHYQQINSHHRNFEEILERDHGLPTSAPNADILKTNSNPVYPNPNRHHSHERHHGGVGGGGLGGPTSLPGANANSGANHNKNPTVPMFPGDMPSYSPPSRAFFTPPLPREYSNPFADKPTLRGTNNDPSVVTNTFINRRIKPPPNAPPSQRIPLRPPDLAGGGQPPAPPLKNLTASSIEDERKKALNTPSKNKEFSYVDPDPAGMMNGSDPLSSSRVVHIPSISRILSGSNGRKEEISDVILRTVTVIPNLMPSLQNTPPSRNDVVTTSNGSNLNQVKGREEKIEEEYSDNEEDEVDEDDEVYDKEDEKHSTEAPVRSSVVDDPEEKVHNLANANHDRSLFTTTNHPPMKDRKMAGLATWTVAWNVHVYLSAILFTVLAVYSIFKMIFFDKLTHLFNQSYFICIHLILIIICLARIFYLCYDAYNTHSSFHIFVSEILLNLPATFLTVAFAILILFLLIRSANHKNNRYSALMRPLTVVVASSVHVGLCITLHYVESYETLNTYYHPATNGGAGGKYLVKGPNGIIYNSPPRILSLICQIIYIFVCLSLGFLYLYIYRMLKRILRNKSQNYIHGYQNLSYAIHITIATALLFILLAALQIYGAIGLSLSKPIMSSPLDIDWLQWGYQFSLRLIEIAIITLLSWVTGLKTSASKVLQREKRLDTHNVSGFALFPCTSSSSQEHFETDYPAVCNANTNLHSYTLRTGKPIYDDNFALNALNMEPQPMIEGAPLHHHHPGERSMPDFNGAALPREIDTGSVVSSMHNSDKVLSVQEIENSVDYLHDNEPNDHYENPNFELRNDVSSQSDRASHNRLMLENGYAEPVNADPRLQQYDFQNFERPNFDRPSSRNEFRASKNLKALKAQNAYPPAAADTYGFQRGYNNYNSFDRRRGTENGIKKSGTLNNIGNAPRRYDQPGGGVGEVVERSQRSAQTLNNSGRQKRAIANGSSGTEWRTSSSSSNNRSSLERNRHLSDDDYPATHLKKMPRENSGLLDPAVGPGSGSSSGESASSGSMLVAEHGFVRFKALDELGQPQQQPPQPLQQKFMRSSGRTSNKERKLTNS